MFGFRCTLEVFRVFVILIKWREVLGGGGCSLLSQGYMLIEKRTGLHGDILPGWQFWDLHVKNENQRINSMKVSIEKGQTCKMFNYYFYFPNFPSKWKWTHLLDKYFFLWARSVVRGESPKGSTGQFCPHLIIHSTAHKLTKYNTLGHFGTLINIQGLRIVVFLGIERKPLKTLPTAVNTFFYLHLLHPVGLQNLWREQGLSFDSLWI